MDLKTSQQISDELYTKCQSFSPISQPLANDFEQILRNIGVQMCCLGNAVTAIADQNASLLDASLEECKGVLQDMLQWQAGATKNIASHNGSLVHPQAWSRVGSMVEVIDVDGKANPEPPPAQKMLSIHNPISSGTAKDPKKVTIARASEETVQAVDPMEMQKSPTVQESRDCVSKEATIKSETQFTNFESENRDSKEERKRPKLKVHKDNSRFGQFRRAAAKAMHSRKAEALVGGLIIANAAVLGHQSDFAVRKINEEPPTAYRVLDVFFTTAFTMELILRFIIDGCRYFFNELNRDRNWNIFDLLMVMSALVEEVVGLLVEGGTTNMSAVRVLRLLRLARVIRVIRVMRVFQDLRLMVAGIVSCAKPLTWALCLLCLIMFCFAVCILQFVGAELEASSEGGVVSVPPDFKEKYGSLGAAISTLYMSITGGIDWLDATDPLVDISPVLVIFFDCYVAFAILCCLNIVTGVFVENAHKMSARDEDHMIMEEMEKHQYWLEDVKRAFAAADEDGSGVIDLEEFRAFQGDPRMQAFLRRLGVDWSLENADRLFKQLDFDKTGTIAFDEFIMAIQKLTGATRAMDMINLMHDAKVMKQGMAKLLRNQDSILRNTTGGYPEMEDDLRETRQESGIFGFDRHRSTRVMLGPSRTMAFGACATVESSKDEDTGQEKGRVFQVRPPPNPQECSILPIPSSSRTPGTSLPEASFSMPGSLEFEDVDGNV